MLNGFCDADLGGDLDISRSTSSYVFDIGEIAMSWRFKLQSQVALSTTKAEYVAATEAVKEKDWLEGLLEELGFTQKDAIMFIDS